MQIGVGRHFKNEFLHLPPDLYSQKSFVRLRLQGLQPLLEGGAKDVGLGFADFVDDVFPDEVLIFLAEALSDVLDFTRGVLDDEGLPEVDIVGWGEVVMLVMHLADVGEEVVVADVEGAALVEEVEDALVEGVEELDDLDVVGEVELGDDVLEALPLHRVLLVDEDLLEVDLVDTLVGVVYAQLLEAVPLEHLEPVDVQQLNLPHLLSSPLPYTQAPVQLLDQPLEHALVHCLPHRVPPLPALPLAQRPKNQLPRNSPPMGHQCLVKLLPLQPQQVSDAIGHLGIFYFAWFVLTVGGFEGEVADEEDSRDDGPDLMHDFLFELQGDEGLVEVIPHLSVVDTVVFVVDLLSEVVEVLLAVGGAGGGLHPVEGALVVADELEELVEDVEIAFACTLANYAALLQEVVLDRGVVDLHRLPVHLQTYQLPETTRVIVLYCLRVAEHLQNRVTADYLVLHVRALLLAHVEDPAAAVANGPQRVLVSLSLPRARLPADADYLRLIGMLNACQDLKHEREDVGLVPADVLTLDEDAVEIGGEAFFGVLFGDKFEGVDDDQAVPQAGVDLVISEPSLQLHQHFGRVDYVHFDEVPLDAVAIAASFQLVRLHFEGSPVLREASHSGVGLIDGERDDSLHDPFDVEVGFIGVGLVYPAASIFGDPADIEQVLARGLLETHSNLQYPYPQNRPRNPLQGLDLRKGDRVMI